MKRDSWDKSLIIATLTWIVLWFVNDLALKRWIPQIDLFVWLIGFVLFAFITLLEFRAALRHNMTSV